MAHKPSSARNAEFSNHYATPGVTYETSYQTGLFGLKYRWSLQTWAKFGLVWFLKFNNFDPWKFQKAAMQSCK